MASVVISGDTSGSVTITAPAVAGTPTLTLPTTTDTLVGKATTDTLTNKTLTSPTISTINLTGGQIAFPATQSASSDANTLDDYEEGTWSPSLGGNTTYSGQDARYTKVGKLVNCFFDITINLIGTGSASAMSGFPFTNSATIATGSVSFYSGIATTTNFISFYIGGSGTSCSFVGNNGNATTIGLNGFAVFGNSARVVGSITYQTS